MSYETSRLGCSRFWEKFGRQALLVVATLVLAACTIDPAGNPQWIEDGPGPVLQGQVEGMPDRPVIGAVYSIAPHPTNPEIVFIGTEGGVWRTADAKSLTPTWTPLTDQLPSLAIASLEFGRFDKDGQTIYAGTGSRSAGAFRGPAVGVYKSTDGGDSWAVLGDANLIGRVVSSLVAVSQESTAANGSEWLLAGTNAGLFLSQDAGVSWGNVLPGNVEDIAADRVDPDVYYALIPGPVGQQLWISQDAGQTWSSSAIAGAPPNGVEMRLAVGTSKDAETAPPLWIATALANGAAFVARTLDRGQSWTALVPPTTNELFGGGIQGPWPGGQMATGHFSLAADPEDENIVYLGGDRQPAIPSSSGTFDWTARLFVGRVGGNPVWTPLVGSFANGSAAHADSRDMAFDVLGGLWQSDDGGVYRMAKPRDEAARRWVSRNGDLRVAQIYSVALDPVNDCLFAGTQDTGSVEQIKPTTEGILWRDARMLSLLNIEAINAVGDGGTVGVAVPDDGYARRYTALNNARMFFYRDFANPNPNVIPAWLQFSASPAPSLPQSGLDPGDTPLPTGFVRFPFAVNAVAPMRLAIGMNAVYESFDSGNTVIVVDPPRQSVAVSALAYGGRFTEDRPAVMYVARGNELSLRENEGASWSRRFVGPAGFSANGQDRIRRIVIDPLSWRIAYMVTRDRVFRIQRAGLDDEQIVELTGNLAGLKATNDAAFGSANGINLQAVELFVGAEPNALLVAGQGGVYRLLSPDQYDGSVPVVWSLYGEGLPNALATDVVYSAPRDRLVVATWGRGVWSVPTASKSLPVAKYRLDE